MAWDQRLTTLYVDYGLELEIDNIRDYDLELEIDNIICRLCLELEIDNSRDYGLELEIDNLKEIMAWNQILTILTVQNYVINWWWHSVQSVWC